MEVTVASSSWRPGAPRVVRGQLHAVGQTLQQRSAELALQRADLLGERRLSDREPLGGPRERSLFDDRQEVGDLAQIHFMAS
jgi:hypothetical protein